MQFPPFCLQQWHMIMIKFLKVHLFNFLFPTNGIHIVSQKTYTSMSKSLFAQPIPEIQTLVQIRQLDSQSNFDDFRVSSFISEFKCEYTQVIKTRYVQPLFPFSCASNCRLSNFSNDRNAQLVRAVVIWLKYCRNGVKQRCEIKSVDRLYRTKRWNIAVSSKESRSVLFFVLKISIKSEQ